MRAAASSSAAFDDPARRLPQMARIFIGAFLTSCGREETKSGPGLAQRSCATPSNRLHGCRGVRPFRAARHKECAMPMITLQIAAEPDARLARDAALLVTGRVAEILGKDPKVTAVAVEFIPRKHWYIGGRSTEEIGKAAFFLDVRIADGTNTKDEKARFVAVIFAALDALLRGVDP